MNDQLGEITYRFHHLGIPTDQVQLNERYSEAFGMFTSDHAGDFRVQFHRFDPDCPLHPLIKALPHVALQVDDLAKAVTGKEILLGPYEPIEGFAIAIINDHGVPIELIQTDLTPDEVWAKAQAQQDLKTTGLEVSAQQQIIDQENRLLAAMQANDIDCLDALLHDDLLFTLPDGQTITKAMDMAVYRSGLIAIHEVAASDQIIQLIGNTAVVAVSIRLKGVYQQQPIDGTFRYIRVWTLVGETWNVIAGSSTRLD